MAFRKVERMITAQLDRGSAKQRVEEASTHELLILRSMAPEYLASKNAKDPQRQTEAAPKRTCQTSFHRLASTWCGVGQQPLPLGGIDLVEKLPAFLQNLERTCLGGSKYQVL